MGKKVKVVFDTNVWISIALKKTLSDEFSRAKQELTVYTSKDILLEISKVLLYPKIAHILKSNQITDKQVLRVIAVESKIVEPRITLHILGEDPDDNRILKCALEARADVIVTGDSHLLELGGFKRTRILTAREFFESLG